MRRQAYLLGCSDIALHKFLVDAPVLTCILADSRTLQKG